MKRKKNIPTATTEEKINDQFSCVEDTTNGGNLQAGFGTLPKEDFDAEYLRLIHSDISDAQNRLEELPELERRGLTLDTFRHFHCGFLPDWILTKSRAEYACGLYFKDEFTREPKHLPPPSARIIIPTPSMQHFNAVATDRFKMERKYWKQHAGSMELFADTNSLSRDLIFIVEGELDAMSIWQCSAGTFAAVAILGCANWKKTLLPILPKLRDKKLLLLFDADAAGKKSANKLLEELLQRGCLAVTKFLRDALPKQEQNDSGWKVDANDILKYHGDAYLKNLLEKVIASASHDFDSLADKIAQKNIFMQEQAKLPDPVLNEPFHMEDKPARTIDISGEVPSVDREQITLILKDFVHAKDLNRAEWCQVGMILKRYGFSVDDWQLWSKDDSRYSAQICASQWKEFKTAEELGGKGYTIRTLIKLAKERGYKPPKTFKTRADKIESGDEVLDEMLADFQKEHGVIATKDILRELENAKIFIDNLTPQTFTVSTALNVVNWKYVALAKFYMPSIFPKFLSVMKAVHNQAKKIIKAVKDETAKLIKAGEPIPIIDLHTIEVLASLVPSKIESEIDKMYTTIQRNHKRYQEELKTDTWKAGVEKEREAHKLLSTKKIFPSCPIDLFLPDYIYLDEKEGIRRVDFDKPAHLRTTIGVCSTPIVPTRIFREPTKNITQYEVAIEIAENIWRSVIVDGRTLMDPRKILDLAEYGALIKHPAHLSRYFADIIHLRENRGRIPEVKFYQQPGWYDDKFIYPAPTADDDYIVRRAGFDYGKEFATQGNADKSKKALLDACQKGGAPAKIFLGNALAALLVRPFNISNMQIQINGTSGSGKTALEKLTASIYGNPRKLIRTFGATLKNRQAVAAAYNDLPTFLDELETVNGGKKGEESLPQMIYDYSLGTANQANKRDGTARETFEFFGSRLMTGERPILKTHDQRGAYKRLVQLHVDNLFDDYFSSALHYISENHFGHFGRHWAKFIERHLEEMRDIYIGFGEIFAEHPQNVEPTQLKAVTVAAIAYQHFLICIGERETFDDLAAAKDIKEIISALPTPADLDDSTRAISDLSSYVAGHEKFFLKEAKNKPEWDNEYTQTAFESYGKKFENGEVAFLPTALKKILENELGYSSADALITEFARKGLLRCTKGRGNRYSTKINGESVAAIRFKAGVLLNECNLEADSVEYAFED